MEENVDEFDLLRAIEEALTGPTVGDDGCATTRELVAKTGRSGKAIRAVLHRLAEVGRLESMSVLRYSHLLGRVHTSRGYKLKERNDDTQQA